MKSIPLAYRSHKGIQRHLKRRTALVISLIAAFIINDCLLLGVYGGLGVHAKLAQLDLGIYILPGNRIQCYGNCNVHRSSLESPVPVDVGSVPFSSNEIIWGSASVAEKTIGIAGLLSGMRSQLCSWVKLTLHDKSTTSAQSVFCERILTMTTFTGQLCTDFLQLHKDRIYRNIILSLVVLASASGTALLVIWNYLIPIKTMLVFFLLSKGLAFVVTAMSLGYFIMSTLHMVGNHNQLGKLQLVMMRDSTAVLLLISCLVQFGLLVICTTKAPWDLSADYKHEKTTIGINRDTLERGRFEGPWARLNEQKCETEDRLRQEN